MKKIILSVLICALLFGCIASLPAHADGDVHVVAHWKFQNVEGYYTGDIDRDDLQFIDLSGNGNDLVTRTVGNGDQLDSFTWDTGVDKGASKTDSALQFNNTKLLAAAVDPYTESETSYSGGFTSGKYLETIKGAPMNTNEFEEGISVDIVFKLSPELDNDYNRYTGIFSRQGVVEGQNEPPFSIALCEWDDDPKTGTIGENKTWMQFVHCDDFAKVNNEMDKIKIGADGWHHLLVTTDGISITYYIDGEPLSTFQDISFIEVRDPNFSWEVGVGRKSGTGHENDCKNENVAEGMIRRLFAGSIAEIRVMDGPIENEDSLYFKSVSYSSIPDPATPKDYDPAGTSEDTESAQLPVDESGAVIIADFTDFSVASKVVNGHNCTSEFDEENGCLKITVTGDDPYFTVPMTKNQHFDGSKYNTLVLTYKTADDAVGEIYFAAKDSPDLADNHIIYYMEAADEFAELEIDMRDDDNGNWTGEIGSIRIDPSQTYEDLVFYFKSVKAKEGSERVETEPVPTEKVTETQKPAETEPQKPADTKAPDTKPVDKPEKSNAGLIIGIIAGVVCAAAIAAGVVIAVKKKKKQ